MAGDSYNVKPAGMIVPRGNPSVKVEKELTAAVKAGMLLEIDSNDYKAKAASGTVKPIGWAAYEHTNPAVRPESYETDYNSGDVITVISGGSFELYALATGEPSTGANVTITAGDLLKSNSDGTLVKWTDGATVTQDGTTPFAVSSVAVPLPPVAIALETITIPKSAGAAGDVKRIHVESLI